MHAGRLLKAIHDLLCLLDKIIESTRTVRGGAGLVDRGVRLVSAALALVVSDQTEKVGVKRKRIEKCLE